MVRRRGALQSSDPLAPVALGVGRASPRGRSTSGSDGMGGKPREHERDPLAGLDGELRHESSGPRRAASTGDRKQSASGPATATRAWWTPPASKGTIFPVVEADHELGAHRHGSFDAFDDPDDVGGLAPRRHEVDHADGPRPSLSWSALEQRACRERYRRAQVRDGRGGGEQPAPVMGRPPGGMQSRRRSRNAGSSTSRSSRCGPRGRRSAGRR